MYVCVLFQSQSEYQKSYRVPRSRSVSPQRYAPLAGLRSDHMGTYRGSDWTEKDWSNFSVKTLHIQSVGKFVVALHQLKDVV